MEEIAGRERAEGVTKWPVDPEAYAEGDAGEEVLEEVLGELGVGELTLEPSGVWSGVVAADDRRSAGVT